MSERNGVDVNRMVLPYFGYATFREYWEASSRFGHCNHGKTIEEAWQSVLKKLDRGVHISAAQWIRDERLRNPNFHCRSVWYFRMPEARATIPHDLMREVDIATKHNTEHRNER